MKKLIDVKLSLLLVVILFSTEVLAYYHKINISWNTFDFIMKVLLVLVLYVMLRGVIETEKNLNYDINE